MSAFVPGERVYVTDAGLAQLRRIMAEATGAPAPPNHYGTVADDPHHRDRAGNDMVLILFDDGVEAPYPVGEVRHLGTGRT